MTHSRRRVVDYLDREAIKWIAESIASNSDSFEKHRFFSMISRMSFSDRLFERADQIADLLHNSLGVDFDEACETIVRCLPAPRENHGYGPMENFRLLPFTRFVSKYGLAHFERSMCALYELTRRFTSEFDVRPFLVRHEDLTLDRFLQWREDKDPHVRRLVSEGTRTRLPWCSHLRNFQKDPSRVVSLIAPMREDASRYVRLSVANNLADLLKDDFDRGLRVAAAWAADSEHYGKWVVKHAIRYFAKDSNPHALALMSKLRLSPSTTTKIFARKSGRKISVKVAQK
jgi:3-methyladenine DNA glycosylase AlkC